MDGNYWVYMMASARNGTLYVGVTGDIAKRVQEHREGSIAGFTAEYGVKTLVWYEVHGQVEAAIRREKSIKRWRRDWKLDLIEGGNPEWRDLWPGLFGGEAGVGLLRVGPG